MYEEDFSARGIINKEMIWVEDCFCNNCYKLEVSTKDNLALDYWLSSQSRKVEGETKPNYYTWHPKVSCKEVSQEFMSNLGQAIQYIWRSNTLKTTKGQSKAEVIADLNKAIDFIKFEIERLENE